LRAQRAMIAAYALWSRRRGQGKGGVHGWPGLTPGHDG